MNKGIKTALIVASILIALLIIIPVAYGLTSGWENWGYGVGWSGMMGPSMMTGLGGWSMMGIFWLVIIGLITWLIVYLARGGGTTAPSFTREHAQALEILKTRYARGEITKEEFDEKRKDIL